jgi:uncharacterized membrane protein YdfJ with MMPL/SSD domain
MASTSTTSSMQHWTCLPAWWYRDEMSTVAFAAVRRGVVVLGWIAAVASSHPRRLAAALVLVLVLGLVFGASASNTLSAHNDFSNPASQSTHAREAIEVATGADPSAGVLALVAAPAGSEQAAHAAALLRGDHVVARLRGPIPSSDGASVLLAATLRAGVDEHAAAEHVKALFASDGAVKLGGATIASREVGAQAGKDLGLAEALAFPLIAILALLIFRGVAALLPLAVGGTSVVVAFAALRAFNLALPLSVFALNLVIGLGLGLAVDYSLFLVSRFREELGAGADTATAVRTTMLTAGRTVVYSAVTVAIAMSSLVVFPLRFLQSMGIGGAFTALIAAAVALTLLPALFVLLGSRLGHVRPGPPGEGRWYALAQAVLRRPAAVALVMAAVMVAISLPALHTHWSGVDAHVLPASASAHAVEDAVEREFPRVRSTPEFVAVKAPASNGAMVRDYAARLARIPGLAQVGAPRYLGRGTWQVEATPAGEAIAPAAQQVIARMRALARCSSCSAVDVGGSGAEFVDQRATIAQWLPYAVAILAAGTLIVLWLMTGSVVLALLALLMNALTVSAATGLLVLIFQDGRLQSALDYSSQRGIEQSNYLVLAAIAFALSTDYGVFLLTRIKEARDRGRSPREAIALGVQRTGRIVTAAAVLLAVAIGAFATSNVVFLKEIGVGAVAAVLLDAFVVRTLLVPALMGLLGRAAWYSPRLLVALHLRLAPRETPANG